MSDDTAHDSDDASDDFDCGVPTELLQLHEAIEAEIAGLL